MVNTTLKNVTLHDGVNSVITENDVNKTANLTILPLYLNDSDLTDVFDFGGTVKLITLTGVYIGDDIDALKSWVESVEALIQGHQDPDADAPYTFTDDLRGILKVKVISFNSTKMEGNSTQIGWVIKLVHSSLNG